jgi:predicted TIM-barrel fold metal-dependent hydrolase
MRLDEMYDMWNSKVLRERLTRRPSDYWRRNCAITATFISRGEVEMRDAIGVGNLLWGSDYPHPEGTWPYTETCLQHAFHGVPSDEAARMLGRNALEFYGFDAKEMDSLAARIGPEPARVERAPEALPSDYMGMGLR